MEERIKKQQEALGYVLGTAANALRNRMHHSFVEAGHDITAEQGIMLINLWVRNGLNQQHLADITHRDKTSVTRLIDGLEKRDLVIRVSDKNDRRQKLLYLTPKGDSLITKLLAISEKVQRKAAHNIPPGELETCKKVLRIIRENVS